MSMVKKKAETKLELRVKETEKFIDFLRSEQQKASPNSSGAMQNAQESMIEMTFRENYIVFSAPDNDAIKQFRDDLLMWFVRKEVSGITMQLVEQRIPRHSGQKACNYR